MYQVQFTTNLAQNAWTDLGSPIAATNSTASAFDAMSNSQKFYRVVLLPKAQDCRGQNSRREEGLLRAAFAGQG
jgi:hypothetical protein